MNLGYRVHMPDMPPAARARGLSGELDECFALLAHIGYASVELAVADPAAAREHLGEVRACSERHGLAVRALCTDPMADVRTDRLLGGSKPERAAALAALTAAVELAGELECPATVGDMVGEPDPAASPSEAMSHACAAAFSVLADRAARAGSWLLLRPTPPARSRWMGSLARARDVAVRTNTPGLRLALDTAWLDLASDDFWADLGRAAPFVRHVVLAGPAGQSPFGVARALERLAVELGPAGHSAAWVAAVVADDQEEAARRAFAHLRPVAAR